jgi:hypothetical protein
MVRSDFLKHMRCTKAAGPCSVVSAMEKGRDEAGASASRSRGENGCTARARTCLPLTALRQLVEEFNKRHDEGEWIDARDRTARQLLDDLQKRLGGHDERRWVKVVGVQGLGKYYKPTMTSNEARKWLNTRQIAQVLRQYEAFFGKTFQFMGVFPSDFSETTLSLAPDGRTSVPTCIGGDMCDFRTLDLLDKGKTSFAMVLNTDKSTEKGEHWVAVWGGLDPTRPNFGFYFFDSNGTFDRRYIPTRANGFLKNVQAETERALGVEVPVRWNTQRLQKRDGECGIFAIVFVVAMLFGEDFDRFCGLRMINDAQMRRLRRVLFDVRQKRKT